MSVFEINDDVLKKVWDSSGEQLYSVSGGKLFNAREFSDNDRPDNISQTQYFLQMGYIPFVNITNDEALRAYKNTLRNDKIKAALDSVDDDKFNDTFWKYFNLYPDLLDDFNKFENEYVLSKVESWCRENGIEYSVK